MAKKRTQFRVPYGKELLLRMGDGYLISGLADNINDGGIFLKARGQEDFSRWLDKSGTLLIELQVETLELPCKIIRITQEGLGIQFES